MDYQPDVKIGAILKALRLKKGLKQEHLSDMLSVKRQTYSAWERDVSYPDINTILFLSKLYDVDTDYLLGKDSKPTSMVSEALSDDPELQAFWDTMKERDDLQLMFKKSKELSPSAIKQIIGIIKLIEDREDEEFGE